MNARPGRCSPPSARLHQRSQGAHTGSGTQFDYPAQATQGPDGTIYTADPLDTIEATSPKGYFEGYTTLGQNSLGAALAQPWAATTSI